MNEEEINPTGPDSTEEKITETAPETPAEVPTEEESTEGGA